MDRRLTLDWRGRDRLGIPFSTHLRQTSCMSHHTLATKGPSHASLLAPSLIRSSFGRCGSGPSLSGHCTASNQKASHRRLHISIRERFSPTYFPFWALPKSAASDRIYIQQRSICRAVLFQDLPRRIHRSQYIVSTASPICPSRTAALSVYLVSSTTSIVRRYYHAT